MKKQDIINKAKSIWKDLKINVDENLGKIEFFTDKERVPEICEWLLKKQNLHFCGIVVEEKNKWDIFYIFSGKDKLGEIIVKTSSLLQDKKFKSVSLYFHGADWFEREAEDLFGLIFEGHPHLGDFILHDDVWQEGVELMRHDVDIKKISSYKKPQKEWRPKKLVDIPGSFIMPVGPVFSGEAESVHFLLETIGEEIIRPFPRLFYKYRGIEKIAEGKDINDVLLLSERFAGTSAFSHSLAYCLAIENLSGVEIPERAKFLRVFFSELERIKNHIKTINGICNSTGLAVANSQTAILEEKVLRLICSITGHRYFFGLNIPGGLTQDFDNLKLKEAVNELNKILQKLNKIEVLLTKTSSFLDRLEEVGIINKEEAREYALVGPVARASGYIHDLRKEHPYIAYDNLDFNVPSEIEGDGYARLRIFFSEIKESLLILEQIVQIIPDGPVLTNFQFKSGIGLSGVETARGTTWHWIHIDENGKIKRYRIIPPSFVNWHGFNIAVRNFAFQDFPIILSTFGLSVAENDR